MFSGKFLTHNQQFAHPVHDKDGVFFNIDAYKNKRLYCHINKLFEIKEGNRFMIKIKHKHKHV